MASSPFVVPEVERLQLADGQWVEVKRELSFGERQRLLTATYGRRNADNTFEIDLEKAGVEKLAIWLVDWSFQDASGKRCPVSRSAISALRADIADELLLAVEEHAQRAAKNARGSAPTMKKPSESNSE